MRARVAIYRMLGPVKAFCQEDKSERVWEWGFTKPCFLLYFFELGIGPLGIGKGGIRSKERREKRGEVEKESEKPYGR